MRRRAVAFALFALLLGGVVAARAHARAPLHVDYYYIPYCMSCARVLHGLESFPRQFGARVELRTIDCFSPAGVAAAKKYGFVTHGIIVADGDGELLFEEKDHGVSAEDVRVIVTRALVREQ